MPIFDDVVHLKKARPSGNPLAGPDRRTERVIVVTPALPCDVVHAELFRGSPDHGILALEELIEYGAEERRQAGGGWRLAQ